MIERNKIVPLVYDKLLSHHTREKTEKIILKIALISFLLHLGVIYFLKLGFVDLPYDSDALTNPISAVSTPFSFILIYEVYLLIYYLSKSFTTYITKQYEIVALIVIRKIFKDLSGLELSTDWFEIKGDLQFTYDLVASIVLFFIIYLFQKQGKQKSMDLNKNNPAVASFVKKKQMIAIILVPLFIAIALYTVTYWGIGILSNDLPTYSSFNNLFFDRFFTILILVDVVVLLISSFYTEQFHKIIRNSGFIISTILIRLSFGVTGIISTILIIVAILFGLAILAIHNKYEKNVVVHD